MDSAEVLARIRAADGQPGVRDTLMGHEVWLHDAHPGGTGAGVEARRYLGQANEAILRKTGMARSGSGICRSACRRAAA
jgi:putative two-component system hydrogenase maturation factor HypX/HoxX